MDTINKLRQRSKFVFVLATLGFILYIVVELIQLFSFFSNPDMYDMYFPGLTFAPADYVTILLLFAPILAMGILFLALLRSVWTDETPFHFTNVRRMKVLALLLLLFWPYGKLVIWCQVRLTGRTFSSVSPGASFLAGLGIYCLAMVFQYGVVLQTQSDETL